jgi:oxepin-CoA hydrolase/3-oxo-5,6-dehydrosuberyl-CoA semialdehyde dehydrogenase
MQLQSYAAGKWHSGGRDGVALRDATTGAVIAHSSADGLDYRGMLEHARRVGGPSLRKLTFHQRAALIKALAKSLNDHKEEFYSIS